MRSLGLSRRKVLLRAVALVAVLLGPFKTQGVVLPAGFTRQAVGGAWNEAVGLTFAGDGRMFVWERAGRVWMVDTNGVRSTQPLIDISDEVGGWRDYGLLGVALHPSFLSNGYIYLLYVVDHHHLIHQGTPAYDPSTNEYFMATIGRITRYTAEALNNFETVDYSSRLVLLGESISNGIPIVHQSHGVGTLLFGDDGTLIVSSGDAASYSGVDTGGAVFGSYAVQALNEGILRPKEDIGALRAQLVDCLNGKILRLDPATGDGLPSNPFFDSLNPRAPRSRVWALGLRNPFRMTLREGSGSHDPAAGDPGTLYIGDVGWDDWEDLNVCTAPGQNFGWPLYEGMLVLSGYLDANVYNLDAPNPLYGVSGCTQEYFYFRDLLVQETLNPPSWPNPCNPGQQVPASIPRFMHVRPAVDWRHTTPESRTGGFDPSGNAIVYDLDDPNSPVPGPSFAGNASTGGTWYEGDDFPSVYKHTYFHGDYGEHWIRNFQFDSQDRPTLVRDFMTDGGGVVFIGTHPAEGNLYYIEWGTTIWRLTYSAGGNQSPEAVISADPMYGPSPLNVHLTGTNSFDPDGAVVHYSWDFGDGSTADGPGDLQHVFTASGGLPARLTVTLVVEDNEGAFSTNTLAIHVNNSPPTVVITSPTNGTHYPLTGDTIYALEASVSDAEHASNELSYGWVTFLHHNTHTHSEPIDTNVTTTTVISPLGCGEETYFYHVDLTVTDPLGLSATDQVFLYPDCPPPTAVTHLVATPLSGSSIGLAWEDTSTTELGFRIERSYDGTHFTAVATTPPNQTAFVDAGLRSATAHYYRVQAYSDAGSSPDSAVVEATTLAGGVVGFLQGFGPNWLVVMEAESFDSNVPRSGKSWITNLTAGSSGGVALEAAPDTESSFNTGYAANSPQLDFQVNFTQTGTHYIWIRGIGLSGTDDSCHAGLDGAEISTSDRISTFGTSWTWSKTTMDSASDATFIVTNTGLHTVNVWMREDGFIFDKLLLTANPGYFPTGMGPAQSPRGEPETPPWISDIADVVTDEDTRTEPIEFSVGDNETDPGNLLIVVESSNTNLVASDGLLLDGSGSNRFLTLTPRSNQFGTGTLTVTVSDGYASTNATFQVAVLSVNDPPAFLQTPLNVVIDELTLMTVTNQASDVDTPANLLGYQLISAPAGAAIDTFGIITWIPSEAQGPSTNAILTVVTDGLASSTNTFVATVAEVNVPPTTVADALIRFETQGVQTPSSTLLTNDFDADGDVLTLTGVISPSPTGASVIATNGFVHYRPVFGDTRADTFDYVVADGNGAAATGQVVVSVQPDPPTSEVVDLETGTDEYVLTFAGIPGVTYTIQYADALESASWRNLVVVTADGAGLVQAVDPSPGGGPARFYRAVRGAAP